MLQLIIIESTIINRRRRILQLIIVESTIINRRVMHFTIINRILQQMQLWCRSSVDTKDFTRPAAITKKTSHPKSTSYRACSVINVIQPKCWRDKLNVKLSFYELSVFTDYIFNVFLLVDESNASVNVVAVKQECRVQCEKNQLYKKIIQIIWKRLI